MRFMDTTTCLTRLLGREETIDFGPATSLYKEASVQMSTDSMGLMSGLHLRRKLGSRLRLWHWPDSDTPVARVASARWTRYSARVR